MVNCYKERFKKMVKTINSDVMIEYAHLNNPKVLQGKEKCLLKILFYVLFLRKG
ncbi:MULTISPECIES: hypothetical protein [unclassified Clostridium]|uniref:hypothetical protein n=1 Tax=unclassified Clostridium TaxID=2614128 RepID=UPI001969A44A